MSIAASASTPHAKNASLRAVVSGTIGTFIEWYDWFIFGIMATIFAQQIFPSDTAIVALLSTFMTYAVGFFVRPLGAIILSPLGDRIGRRNVMALTIGMMALGSLITAVTPPYAAVGILAPIMVLVARIIQGISAGGEVQSAIPFMVEHAPEDRKGLAGSMANVSSGIATLVATGLASAITTFIPQPELSAWGWRIPFFLGALFGLFGLYLRWNIPETPEFERVKQLGHIEEFPIRRVLREHPMACLQVAALQAAAGVYYIFAKFLPTYANLVSGIPLSWSFAGSMIGVTIYIVLVPLFGYLSDRFFWRKTYAIAAAVGIVLFLYPLFLMLNEPSFWKYLFVATCGWIMLSLVFAVYPVLFVELFPAELRATGIGIPYHIVTAAIAGTAPLIATYFIKAGVPLYTALYMMGIMAVAGVIYTTMPRTPNRRRTTP
jgi:MHS family alpha-ketoglutarate permease-like MFS transporter